MILVEEGRSPLIVCLPHSGTDVPEFVLGRFNATGRLQADLAWRLEQVFDPRSFDCTVVRSTTSRYVIDLDRGPASTEDETGTAQLSSCPLTTHDGKPLYQEGEEPGPVETEQRTLLFYDPFHTALRRQLDRLLKLHEKVILLDCQSMRSNIQGVTDKGLPLVSIGSNGGRTCDPDLRNLLVGSFKGLPGYTVGVDEYAKGGFIVRTYGRPDLGVHALTLLLAQRSYLRHESPPFEPDKTRIARLQAVLADSMSRMVDWTGVQNTEIKPEPDDEPAEPDETDEAPEDLSDSADTDPLNEPEPSAAETEDAGEEAEETNEPNEVALDLREEGSTEQGPLVETSEVEPAAAEDPDPAERDGDTAAQDSQEEAEENKEKDETKSLMVAE